MTLDRGYTRRETAAFLQIHLEEYGWHFGLDGTGRFRVVVGDTPPNMHVNGHDGLMATLNSLAIEYEHLLKARSVH